MSRSIKVTLALSCLMLFAVSFDSIPNSRQISAIIHPSFILDYLWQIVVFAYLTFIPGFILLTILKPKKMSIITAILFSLGLSIAFLMFTGLLVNELYPLLGISKPLSMEPLVITISSLVILLCFVSYFRDGKVQTTDLELSPSVLFFFVPIALCIFGTSLVNTSGNSFLLQLMILAIVVLVLLGYKLITPKVHPFLLFAIGLALLYHTSLITNYIVGWDVNSEYHVFKMAEIDSHWSPAVSGVAPELLEMIENYNSMLSVTVLPTIYSKVLNMDGTSVFKIIYPFIFSFVPMALYELYSGRLGKREVFLSVFFFLANNAFFWVDGVPAKQMIAELFYVLLFLVFLNKKMDPLCRSALFIVFSAGLIVSHYSISYIFIFIIFLTWLSSLLMREGARGTKKERLTVSLVALFCTMAFSWYIYVSSSPFENLVRIGDDIYSGFMNSFFNPEARGSTVMRGLGLGASTSLAHQISRFLFYAIELFIAIGFVKMLYDWKKGKGDQEYNMITFLHMMLLGMSIVLPNFAPSFRVERFFGLSLFFLSPLCIVGGETAFRFLLSQKKRLTTFLLLSILISFFLFQTDLVYALIGDSSWSIGINMYRVDRVRLYSAIVDEKEVFGAKWLSKNLNSTDTHIYGDLIATQHVLTSYGAPMREVRCISSTSDTYFLSETDYILANVTLTNIALANSTLTNSTLTISTSNNITLTISRLTNSTLTNSTLYIYVSEPIGHNYVYLRKVNIADGIMLSWNRRWNTTYISPFIDNQNEIYSNGGCEIYYKWSTEGGKKSPEDWE